MSELSDFFSFLLRWLKNIPLGNDANPIARRRGIWNCFTSVLLVYHVIDHH